MPVPVVQQALGVVLGPPGSRLLLHVCADGKLTEHAAAHPVLALCARLAVGHQLQWDAEDRCRRPGADVAVIAAAKRRIDQLNAARTVCVDAVDAWVAAHVRTTADLAVSLHTETIGTVVDRLVIADLRARRAGTDIGPTARRQRDELAAAYDTLLAEVAAGVRRLPDWRALKQYEAMP